MNLRLHSNQSIESTESRLSMITFLPARWKSMFAQARGSIHTKNLDLDELLYQFHSNSRIVEMQGRSLKMLTAASLLLFTLFNASVLLYTLTTVNPTMAGVELIILIELNLLLGIITRVPALLLGQYRAKQRLRCISNALSDFEDVRVIGPLLESLSSASPFNRNRVKEGLEHAFALLCSPSIPLSTMQKRAIKDILHSTDPSEIQFKIQLLKVLPHLGDETFIPIVENLTLGRSTRLRYVRNAARECLPSLLSRADRLAVSRFLLKPSSGTEQSLLHIARWNESAHLIHASEAPHLGILDGN